MKNIIVFYQVINREKKSCMELKKVLEESNNINVYVFSIDFENDLAIRLSKKVKIDMILMPWMYQDSNYYLMKPYIDNNPNIVIVNLHHEQIASEASLPRMLPSGSYAKNSVVHFIWGEYFREALISVGVKENLIFCTGNIRTDELCNSIKDRESIAKEFGLDLNKKWILFSENRGWVLTYNVKKEADMINLGYSKKDVLDRKKIAEESLDITISELNKLDDNFFDKYELIYRPHPGTKASDGISPKIRVIDKYPIAEWLNVIDVNVVWSSTTIFESDLKKIPSFVYEPIPNLKRHKTYGLDEYHMIRSLNEINDELIKDYYKNIASKKIYEKYIGKVDGNSVERVKKYIIEILDNGIDDYKARQIRYDKKMFYKTILFQKMTRLIVKCGLLEKIKYPKSAYELRKDIPYRLEKN